MKYMTKMRQGRERGGEGGGGIEGGVHRVLDHTYPELSVARATLVLTSLIAIFNHEQDMINNSRTQFSKAVVNMSQLLAQEAL